MENLKEAGISFEGRVYHSEPILKIAFPEFFSQNRLPGQAGLSGSIKGSPAAKRDKTQTFFGGWNPDRDDLKGRIPAQVYQM